MQRGCNDNNSKKFETRLKKYYKDEQLLGSYLSYCLHEPAFHRKLQPSTSFPKRESYSIRQVKLAACASLITELYRKLKFYILCWGICKQHYCSFTKICCNFSFLGCVHVCLCVVCYLMLIYYDYAPLHVITKINISV